MVRKSQTTTWRAWNPVNDGIFTILTGAGFLPSTVFQTEWIPKMTLIIVWLIYCVGTPLGTSLLSPKTLWFQFSTQFFTLKVRFVVEIQETLRNCRLLLENIWTTWPLNSSDFPRQLVVFKPNLPKLLPQIVRLWRFVWTAMRFVVRRSSGGLSNSQIRYFP